jgi:hypothetical protein
MRRMIAAAGTLRIWATIGGHRTNTLRIRVLPKPC